MKIFCDVVAYIIASVVLALPFVMLIGEIVHIRLLKRKVKSIEHIEQILDYSIPHVDCGGSGE